MFAILAHSPPTVKVRRVVFFTGAFGVKLVGLVCLHRSRSDLGEPNGQCFVSIPSPNGADNDAITG